MNDQLNQPLQDREGADDQTVTLLYRVRTDRYALARATRGHKRLARGEEDAGLRWTGTLWDTEIVSTQ